MTEVIRLDGVDIALTPDAIGALLSERKRQYEELRGRFDAIGLELEKEKAARAALEDPVILESKVQSRLKLLEKCRRILGDDIAIEGKTDEELKLLGIKKSHPDIDLSGKDQSYIDGMFEALMAASSERNDSLAMTRHAIHQHAGSKANQAYEKWIEHSAKMWTVPLTGSAR